MARSMTDGNVCHVCLRACVDAYGYICTFADIYIYTSICTPIYIYTHVSVCVCESLYVCGSSSPRYLESKHPYKLQEAGVLIMTI